MAADPPFVTSTRNPLVQRFRAAAAGDLPEAMMAEGVRLVAEAVAAGLRVHEAAVAPRCTDAALRARLREVAGSFVECSDAVLAALSSVDTPQGVAVVLARPAVADDALVRGDAAPLVVAAAGLRDPGNLGAVIRTAEAAGASGVLTMRGGADPFRDKALRGSMGSVFRLPVRHGADAAGIVAFARRHRLQLVVADGGDGKSYTAADLRRPTLLVLGAEADGVPGDLLMAADARVRIPLRPPVESLNVAVAAGVLLFEARRQRG